MNADYQKPGWVGILGDDHQTEPLRADRVGGGVKTDVERHLLRVVELYHPPQADLPSSLRSHEPRNIPETSETSGLRSYRMREP